MAGLYDDDKPMLGALYGNPLLLRQFANQRGGQQEAQFQQWIRALPWFSEFQKRYGEVPNVSPSADYDYRAAWRAGITPQRDQYDQNSYHWPSSLPNGQMLKSANHPTAWKEYFMRKTGQNPDALGLKTPEDAESWFMGK